MTEARAVTIGGPGGAPMSGLFTEPAAARLCLVMAHGAGAGMDHPFMAAMAAALAAEGVATLRYQFPYMEKGGRRPDPPRVLEAAARAAVTSAQALCPGAVLLAGGKSMGGRMTSQAAAAARGLEGVRGLVFIGFPLHTAGAPEVKRARHLDAVGLPMLFLQGTRDRLADIVLMTSVCQKLGPAAVLHVVAEGDHSFKVPRRAGKSEADVVAELAERIARFGRDFL